MTEDEEKLNEMARICFSTEEWGYIQNYTVKCSWENHPELTSTFDIEASSIKEAVKVAYGMCGDFYFDQGGHGDMPCPTTVEVGEDFI